MEGGFEGIRALARQFHSASVVEAGGVKTAEALLEAATRLTGIERQAVSDDDPILCGAEAILERSVSAIFFKSSVTEDVAAFYQAHEFGHHWIDDIVATATASAGAACFHADLEVATPEERMPLGAQRVEGYGPRERRECQANVFAREFLLPSQEARRLFVEERLTADHVAARLGVPITLVHQQLAHGLLVPDPPATESGDGETRKRPPPLDRSQRAAAEASEGPLLIEAGPGTGKTRTLVSRIVFLIGLGTAPESILALTFSNKAAEEMRERVAAAAPGAAAAIWAGTFHAFGLELLRKWGHLLGLPSNVRLVDPSDALFLLERELLSLPLFHYLRLHEPALPLQDILAAVSRAKDELVTPERYLELSEDMLVTAGADETARTAAERTIEVARVFAIYETILHRECVVDFADLIVKSIEILHHYPTARDVVRAQFRHLLVDEYQDVNRASAVLLKLIAGEGENLWVVGDARQSIYRFRGAAPANIREFERDFPGARRLALETNYRSQAPVVRLVEAFAPTMRASRGGLPAHWNAQRGKRDGEVLVRIASNVAAEATGIAREVERLRGQGVSYRDQAILCRSHTNLARFAELLEARGIPVLYLGDIFERPEIRDLLSLLSLMSEPTRGGLLRVATFPEYAVPLADVRAVLSFARNQELDPPAALRRLPEIAGLTPEGRQGLERIAMHVDGFNRGTPPSMLLASYLFTRSRYLDAHFAEGDVAAQQRRLAIYQFLQFAFEHSAAGVPGGGDSKVRLLDWIRRLETFGDERQLRQMPAAAAGVDAVRLLTVHASKGLEFAAVFLPGLAVTMFPAQRQYDPCPPPVGLVVGDPIEAHAEEEECLFFVALSRARDVLCLSRAEEYRVRRKPSLLLLGVAAHLPSRPDGVPVWTDPGPVVMTIGASLSSLVPHSTEHWADDLDQYLRCPRQYFYQRILGLSGAREDSAYVQFHRCVYRVLRWMADLPDNEADPSLADAMAAFDAAWAEIGPADHPYAELYWAAAEEIVRAAVARYASRPRSAGPVNWDVRLPRGIVRLRPDHVDATRAGEIVVQRLRTGRPPSTVDDDIYALYHAGAAQAHPDATVRVEVLYLAADTVVEPDMGAKKIANRLKKYDDAIDGIASGRFPNEPKDERGCPRCAQYFVCSALPSD